MQNTLSGGKRRWALMMALGAVLTSACSSTGLEVTSNPSGAEVTVKPLGSGLEKKLGQTPLTLKPDELEGVPSGSGPLRFKISKDGYQPVELILGDAGASDVKVHAELLAGMGFDNPVILNEHLEKIFLAQELVRRKKTDDAIKILEGVRDAVPGIAVVHELLGGAYYVKGDKTRARASFEKALVLNPTSTDALSMQKLLDAPAAPAAGGAAPVTPAAPSAPSAPAAPTAPATGGN